MKNTHHPLGARDSFEGRARQLFFNLESKIFGEVADEREFFFFAVDDVHDAEEGKNCDYKFYYPPKRPESPKHRQESPEDDGEDQEHQALLGVEFYERVILRSKKRNNNQGPNICQDAH